MVAKISFATLIGILAAIAVSGPNIESLNQFFILWFVFVVVCGLALPISENEKAIKAFLRPILPIVIFSLVVLMILWINVTLAGLDYEKPEPRILHMFGRTFPYTVVEENRGLVIGFWLLLIIGSLVGTALSSIGHARIKKLGKAVWEIGPEGFERADKIVRAVIALVGSAFILISIFG